MSMGRRHYSTMFARISMATLLMAQGIPDATTGHHGTSENDGTRRPAARPTTSGQARARIISSAKLIDGRIQTSSQVQRNRIRRCTSSPPQGQPASCDIIETRDFE